MSPSGRRVPRNLEAEESLLGAALLSGVAVQHLLGCDRDDFYKPSHAALYDAVGKLWAEGAPVDPVTVSEALDLAEFGGPDATRDTVRRDLLRIQAATPASANATHYAKIVGEYGALRRVIGHGGAVVEAGYAEDLERALDLLTGSAESIRAPVADVEAIDALDLVKLPPEEIGAKPYLIPGLFRAGERLVLTGKGGIGKSTWCRQIAVCLAAALHPFVGLPCPRKSSLIVDLQEDQRDLAEALWPLIAAAGKDFKAGQLHVKTRPQGLNLLTRADARWLEGLLKRYRPDLLVIGPLRKMTRQMGRFGKSSEEAVDELTLVLDEFRNRYGVAMILEGHPGLSVDETDDWRPRGSSVWLDWPEYGFGLAKVDTNADAEKGARGQVPGERMARLKRWPGRMDRHAGRPWPGTFVSSSPWPWGCLAEATAAMRNVQISDDLAQLHLDESGEGPF